MLIAGFLADVTHAWLGDGGGIEGITVAGQ